MKWVVEGSGTIEQVPHNYNLPHAIVKWIYKKCRVRKLKLQFILCHAITSSHAHICQFMYSSDSSLKDTTQSIDHVAANELKSAAACFSLTSVNWSNGQEQKIKEMSIRLGWLALLIFWFNFVFLFSNWVHRLTLQLFSAYSVLFYSSLLCFFHIL